VAVQDCCIRWSVWWDRSWTTTRTKYWNWHLYSSWTVLKVAAVLIRLLIYISSLLITVSRICLWLMSICFCRSIRSLTCVCHLLTMCLKTWLSIMCFIRTCSLNIHVIREKTMVRSMFRSRNSRNRKSSRNSSKKTG